MSEDLKSSAHVWDGRSATSEDSPPAYIGIVPDQEDENPPEISATSVIGRQQRRSTQPRPIYDPLKSLSTLALIPYQKYNIPDGTLSKDKSTVTVKQKNLYTQPRHLIQFILEQSRLPPRPVLRILGRRESAVDFDITLNLTHLIDVQNYRCRIQSAQRSPLQNQSLYANDDEVVDAHITSIAKRFCNDRGENKSLTLTRSVEGIPTDMLAGQVRNLAAAIRYRGVLRIDFIYERSKVVIHKEPSGWISNILRLHAEQKYDVVESVWSLGDGSGRSQDGVESDLGLRIGHEWWASWSGTIRNAMIRKCKGGVLGIDEWIEARMGHAELDPAQDWGQDYAL